MRDEAESRLDTINRRVGATLRAKRKSKGFSQDKLARAAELSRTSVACIELGQQECGIETFIRLANALQEPASDLLAEILSQASTRRRSKDAWLTTILGTDDGA